LSMTTLAFHHLDRLIFIFHKVSSLDSRNEGTGNGCSQSSRRKKSRETKLHTENSKENKRLKFVRQQQQQKGKDKERTIRTTIRTN